jgi:predicted  nucleic acid-binding Zn-ribbon protein
MRYQCPPTPRADVEDDIVGCGHIFEAEPDEEGLIDCPNCGMWFDQYDCERGSEKDKQDKPR